MNFFVASTFMLTLVAVVLSGPVEERENTLEEDDNPPMKYFLVETEDGHYRIEDLVNGEPAVRALSTDVTYYYFSRSTPTAGILVRYNGAASLASLGFTVSRPTVFIIHGWTNNRNSAVNTHITQALLPDHDINLFVVDWSPIASGSYLSAQGSGVQIGTFVADFVRSLVSRYGLRVETVTCIGHSLGAHVCGNAGASLRGEMDHIMGLDPAGPLFTVSNINNRLDPTDARFVEIIHTDAGGLGFPSSIGHVDYYPNGGKSQPGCGLDITGLCSHGRAYEYFAESAGRNRFLSKLCNSYSDFSNNRCGDKVSLMGGYDVDYAARGNYYLDTNSGPPYARG